MKACHIGKTIIIWDKLNDSEISRFINAIFNLISSYKQYTNNEGYNKPIPIKLFDKNQYLGILKKHNEIVISISKLNKNWNFIPILNADELYKSLDAIEQYNLQKYLKSYEKFPDTYWIKLPYNQAFESYSLSPNINPENFIKNLEKGTLSNQDKQFLKEVGISLEKQDYSKEVKDMIDEINELLDER